MKKIMVPVIVASTIMISGCSDSIEAMRALYNAGYKDIQTYGYSWFACGEDDFYSTKFTATNPNGKKISGTVCSGLFFKNSTIQF